MRGGTTDTTSAGTTGATMTDATMTDATTGATDTTIAATMTGIVVTTETGVMTEIAGLGGTMTGGGRSARGTEATAVVLSPRITKVGTAWAGRDYMWATLNGASIKRTLRMPFPSTERLQGCWLKTLDLPPSLSSISRRPM